MPSSSDWIAFSTEFAHVRAGAADDVRDSFAHPGILNGCSLTTRGRLAGLSPVHLRSLRSAGEARRSSKWKRLTSVELRYSGNGFCHYNRNIVVVFVLAEADDLVSDRL